MGKWRKSAICLLLTVVCGVLFVPITPSDSYVHAAVSTPLFKDIQGFRWKPQLGDRDLVLSKVSYTGEARKSVAADKVDNHVQYATIDVTPKRKLIENSGFTEEQARTWKDQQYVAIADFIDEVKDYNIQFFLHARVNDESEFTDDMVETIKAVKARGLGDKLKGVMIGENDNKNVNQNHLELALDVADNINKRTDNWLKHGKALTLHGKKYGSSFTGIQALVDKEKFFKEISKEVSEFSFAFKFFDPEGGLVPPSGDLSDVNVWMDHFNTNLGLAELKTVLNDNRFKYPKHTHVIFVGDSTDSLYAVMKMNRANTILTALKNVFYNNGWHGFIFNVPFDYRDIIEPNEPKRGMWGSIMGDGTFPVQSQLSLWQDWKTKMSN